MHIILDYDIKKIQSYWMEFIHQIKRRCVVVNDYHTRL